MKSYTLKEAPAASAVELKNNNKSTKAKRILVGCDVHLRGYQAARKIDDGAIGVVHNFRSEGGTVALHREATPTSRASGMRLRVMGQMAKGLVNGLNTTLAQEDRHRHGEKISTAFAESAVNQVVSKRMVKKQQMRWTESGAHEGAQ